MGEPHGSPTIFLRRARGYAPRMGVVGLDHVQVAAPPGCEDAARAFYGGLLGLVEIPKPPLLARRGGCWFTLGAHQLHVGVDEAYTVAAKAHPGIAVGSETALHELADRLEGAGVEVEWADPAEIEGTKRFHVRDPWGNRLELLTVG